MSRYTKGSTFSRPVCSEEWRDIALSSIRERLQSAIAKNGPGVFVSTHEILGVLSEEFDELKASVHKNDTAAVCQELLDLGAGVAFALASIYQEKVEEL